MKRQHRSTLDRCRIYLEEKLASSLGYIACVNKDALFEDACRYIADTMNGDLTFDNWKTACDKAYPIC